MTNDQIIKVLKEVVETIEEGFPQTAKGITKKLAERIQADDEQFTERRGVPVEQEQTVCR